LGNDEALKDTAKFKRPLRGEINLRLTLLTDGISQKVFQHVRENAAEKDIYFDSIGVTSR
jgi:hypothetical protein